MQISVVMRVWATLLMASASLAQDGGTSSQDCESAAGVTIELREGDDVINEETELGSYFSKARCECGSTVTVRVEVTDSTLASDTSVETYVGSNCDDAPEDCTSLGTSTVDELPDEMTFQASDLPCSGDGESGVFVIVKAEGQSQRTACVTFRVDAAAPTAPTKGALSEGEGGVEVDWESDGSDLEFQVFCAKDDTEDCSDVGEPAFADPPDREYETAAMLCGDGDGKSGPTELDPAYLCSDGVGASEDRIGGLTNRQQYHFWVVAYDGHDNPSGVTDLGCATPTPTEDFFEHYVRSGGAAEPGFCAMAMGRVARGAGWLGLLTLILLGALVSLRRRIFITLLALSGSQAAWAADDVYASPQQFALELRFGPYQPDVDKEFSAGQTPYDDVFGDASAFHMQAELDWQFFRPIWGSFGLGTAFGVFWETAQALTETGERAEADDTSLRAYTMWFGFIYRADSLARLGYFPLVPYVKLGLDYYIWWITEGDGSVANHPDDHDIRARGGAAGWQWGAGAMFLLDVVDPRAAKVLDTDTGINHSYIFFEWFQADVDNFGGDGIGSLWEGPTLHLGDSTWVAGLAFEF